jgi:glutamyl-Q tRNA(Asp) synthetase
VLRGKERAATYHLAVVVDDAIQGITDVVRGRDILPATSIHVLLQALLRLETPRYRHHRLVLDASGAKMSKSAASRPLAELRDAGFSAQDLRAALGFGGRANRRLDVTLS